MRRLLSILLLAGLLAGCALQSRPADEQRLSRAELVGLLEREAFANQAAGLDRGSLDSLLLEGQDSLAPDPAFERIHQMISGKSEDSAAAFRQALADYLLEPDFHCRQPILARYFSNRYPAPDPVECTEAVPFSVLNRYISPSVIWLEPERVQEIHLLFAGKSGNLASRFGHVALRLVICPRQMSPGQSCDPYLKEHLVLGYRANVDELSISMSKALWGGYKAYLYANPFLDVYREYAIDEFRELYSLPLRLEAGQRRQMVRELSELHWRFSADYRFFSRNCATLLQEALQLLWPDYAHAVREIRRRPDRFFGQARQSPLTAHESLADLARAERNGHYFPSTRHYYDKALDVVRQSSGPLAVESLEAYLQLHPSARAGAIQDAAYRQRLRQDAHLRGAQLVLEEYAVSRSEREVAALMIDYLRERDALERVLAMRAQLDEPRWTLLERCVLQPVKELAMPQRDSRGIPSRLELPPQDADEPYFCLQAENTAVLRGVLDQVIDRDEPAFLRIRAMFDYHQASRDNVAALMRL